LQSTGRKNIEDLNEVLKTTATSWMERVEVK
ncbi:tagatose 1,6-diphosphate aldolase, partial [Granulicatella balaenopterae]